jgi:CheY-like chemotaxis protein
MVRAFPVAEGALRVEVEDSGIGIAPEDIGRLFVEFQQLDASTAKKYPGTGLGLALTKRIIEAQGGRVGVRSRPGEGSTFFAVLPRVALGVAQSKSISRPAHSQPPDGAPRILVVEDDRAEREWLVATLADAGYAVEAVETGAEAVSRCRVQVYSLITLDLMLPDTNGRELLATLRGLGPNQMTPVVVVTVMPDHGMAVGGHVQGILLKPVSAQDLLASLEDAGVRPAAGAPILVVDDDPMALRLAETVLGRSGYQVVCRSDGEGGLEAAQRATPAAVLLDLLMPGMDGYQFLAAFRATAAGARVPVLIWTQRDMTAKEKDHLRGAAEAVVLKKDGHAALLQELLARVPPRGTDNVRTGAIAITAEAARVG